MHESITLQMLQFFFFYTRSLGNGNSKFRLWKTVKKIYKKKLQIISTKKKKCSTILTISILGKKGTVTCILQNIFCIWRFLIWYAKHEIPMQNFWGLLANFFLVKLQEVARASTSDPPILE